MRKNSIDIILSLSLFMVFVIACFMLLLFQVQGYHDLQYDSDNLHTVSSFLQTAIRHGDANQAVRVEQIEQQACLVIQHENEKHLYYIKDQQLMELYQDATLPIDLSLGEKRFHVDQWNITIQDRVVHIALTKDEQQINIHMRLQSGGVI